MQKKSSTTNDERYDENDVYINRHIKIYLFMKRKTIESGIGGGPGVGCEVLSNFFFKMGCQPAPRPGQPSPLLIIRVSPPPTPLALPSCSPPTDPMHYGRGVVYIEYLSLYYFFNSWYGAQRRYAS
jgi:hypothetical protein